MDGGYGDDGYYVDDAGDVIVEYDGAGDDWVHTTVDYNIPQFVEDLAMGGSADIDAFGNSLDNNIAGNSGNNDIYGGGGHDTLSGAGGNDHLYGNTGNDSLIGGTGRDTMAGGRDDDTYYVDRHDDVVIENADEGRDRVVTDVTYTLTSNVEDLTLWGFDNVDGGGNELSNVLTGNDGNNMLFGYGASDTLNGGAGWDTLFGGEGDDTYIIEGNEDTIIEHAGQGSGHDIVYSSGNYDMVDNVEHLVLTGYAVMGFGNSDLNIINGHNGANYIDGRGGSDHISGGGGEDTFVFRAHEAEGDAIYDFSGITGEGDELEFQGYGEGAYLQQLNATQWLVSSADNTVQDIINLVNAPTLVAGDDYHFT
jgi:Ca2+-binding RTX toxin-like protein